MPVSPHPRPASALDRLADEYVDLSARLDPFLATSVGIPGHDGEVTDLSPAAEVERTGAARALRSWGAALRGPRGTGPTTLWCTTSIAAPWNWAACRCPCWKERCDGPRDTP